jgi:hypothetical protein
VEFVGALPVLVLAARVCVQALLVALSLVFAQLAAQRAAGGMDEAHALRVVPAGWRARVSTESVSTQVRATVRTPALLPGAGRWLRVSAVSKVQT